RHRARHQMIPPHVDAFAPRRSHILRVVKPQNAERRIQPQFGLSHRGAKCVAELFELTESLEGGIAAIIGNRLEWPKVSAIPAGRPGKRCGLESCAVKKREKCGGANKLPARHC